MSQYSNYSFPDTRNACHSHNYTLSLSFSILLNQEITAHSGHCLDPDLKLPFNYIKPHVYKVHMGLAIVSVNKSETQEMPALVCCFTRFTASNRLPSNCTSCCKHIKVLSSPY